ncbi:hypothetical protein [Nocardioides humi]|nr:hypothetical protein [Nocardioides humi]
MQAVALEATSLRRAGARWVVALWHNGVTWTATGTRTGRWETETSAVAASFDLILGGHTLTGWSGVLHGVPAGHGHGFAGSVLVVDLPADGAARVHAPHVLRTPAAGSDPTPGTGPRALLQEQLRRWQGTTIGHLRETLTMRPGEANDLGDFIARAWLDRVADADAAIVPACELWTQPPIDGTVAALLAGDISELDLRRLFPFDDTLVLIELGAGRWERLLAAHDRMTDFANTEGDAVWWNWARGRAGIAQESDSPRRLVTSRFAARLLDGAGAELRTHPSDVHASAPVAEVLQR